MSEALKKAPKELHTTRMQLQTNVDYATFGTIERYLTDQQYTFTKEFSDTVTLTILLPQEDLEPLKKQLQDITSGAVDFEELGFSEVTIPITMDTAPS